MKKSNIFEKYDFFGKKLQKLEKLQFSFDHSFMSFYPILTLIPWIFQKLLKVFKKIKFEVAQLHFVCFPSAFCLINML